MADPLLELLRQNAPPLTADAVQFLHDLGGGANLRVRRFPLPDDPWSTTVPHFYFQYELSPYVFEKRIAWSATFEGELLKRQIRMDHLEEESARGGVLLIDNLQYADLRFGKDYTDHVFWHLGNDRFINVPAIRQTLEQIPHYNVSFSQSYMDCQAYLTHCVNGYGNSLQLELHYQRAIAYRILVGAVWYVLDRRHSLSLRRSVFP